MAIAIFYLGVNYLKGRNLFSTARSFYAVFENVDGLLPSAPVTVNGLQVGVIDDVYFMENDPSKIVVKIRVSDKSLRIPEDTKAHIKSDLLGTRTMYFEIGRSTNYAERNDTISGILDVAFTDELSETIKPLKSKVESLIESVDSVLVVFREIFEPKTRQGLVSSFESINRSVLRFEHTVDEFDKLVTNERGRLSDIFSNIRSITDNLKENNEHLSHIFANIDKITDDVVKSNVQKTMTDLQGAVAGMQDVMQKMQRGEGSVGQLVNNDTLYRNLESSANSLNLLLEDLRLHPKRYVSFSIFGGREKSEKKGK